MACHYLIKGSERRLKLHSSGSFDDACLCGNGSFHAVKARLKHLVDCPICVEILATKPDYLDNS